MRNDTVAEGERPVAVGPVTVAGIDAVVAAILASAPGVIAAIAADLKRQEVVFDALEGLFVPTSQWNLVLKAPPGVLNQFFAAVRPTAGANVWRHAFGSLPNLK